MELARRVNRPTWLREAPDGSPGPCADVLMNDLATSSGRQSWWVVDHGKEDIAVAIASGRDQLSNVDLAIVATEELERLKILLGKDERRDPLRARQRSALRPVQSFRPSCMQTRRSTLRVPRSDRTDSRAGGARPAHRSYRAWRPRAHRTPSYATLLACEATLRYAGSERRCADSQLSPT